MDSDAVDFAELLFVVVGDFDSDLLDVGVRGLPVLLAELVLLDSGLELASLFAELFLLDSASLVYLESPLLDGGRELAAELYLEPLLAEIVREPLFAELDLEYASLPSLVSTGE